MANRLSVTGGRVIISKPGYNAEASLPDAFKVFDSAWGISGLIVAKGVVDIPNNYTTYTINFPPQHYVPYAEVICRTTLTGTKIFSVPGYCTNSQIILGSVTGSLQARGLHYWTVYGLSQ